MLCTTQVVNAEIVHNRHWMVSKDELLTATRAISGRAAGHVTDRKPFIRGWTVALVVSDQPSKITFDALLDGHVVSDALWYWSTFGWGSGTDIS